MIDFSELSKVYRLTATDFGTLVTIENRLIIHFVNMPLTKKENDLLVQFLHNLRKEYTIPVIQLTWKQWEDQHDFVVNILRAKLGQVERIHGRKVIVRELDIETATDFVNVNHLQGATLFDSALGLFGNERLLAVALFGKPRQMVRDFDESYVSGELIRFCSARGIRVYGGLDKLLKASARQFNLRDIMTYSDYNISDGMVYQKLGFEKRGELLPMAFEASRGGWKRTRKPDENKTYYWNSGSEKYVLPISVSGFQK